MTRYATHGIRVHKKKPDKISSRTGYPPGHSQGRTGAGPRSRAECERCRSRTQRYASPVPRSSFFLLLSLLIAIRHCVTCLAPITHLSRVCALVGTIPTHHPHWTTFIGAGGRGLAARGTSLPPTLHPATHISHTSVPPRRTWRRPGRTAWSPRQRQGMTTIGDHHPHAHRRGCTYHVRSYKNGTDEDGKRFTP